MLAVQQLYNNADVSNIFIFFRKNVEQISIVVQLLRKSRTNNIFLK
jgi:hypothetical protein